MDDHYGISVLMNARIKDAQEQINKNMNECLFGPRVIYVPTIKEKISAFFAEIKTRLSNAYDCLVKGVDPYDGY